MKTRTYSPGPRLVRIFLVTALLVALPIPASAFLGGIDKVLCTWESPEGLHENEELYYYQVINVCHGTTMEVCIHRLANQGWAPYTFGLSSYYCGDQSHSSNEMYRCFSCEVDWFDFEDVRAYVDIDNLHFLVQGVSCTNPECVLQPTSLSFTVSEFGHSQERTFSITNVGTGTLSGNVGEPCLEFTVTPGSYSLGQGETQPFTVVYTPTDCGNDNCTISTGAACSDVNCSAYGPADSPLAAFETDTCCVNVGQDVQFTDLSTGGPTEWLWDFGDHEQSEQQHPVHAYNDIGSYAVKLIARNPCGADTLLTDHCIVVSNNCWLDPGTHTVSHWLRQNAPNPTTQTTLIRYALPRREHVRLTVTSVDGRVVEVLVDSQQEMGVHTIHWDFRGASGQRLNAGSYFYRLETPSFSATKKLVLMQ